MNWLLKLIFAALKDMLAGAVGLLAKFIDNIFTVMYDLNQGLKLDKAGEFTVNLACVLVAFYAVKLGIDTYVLKTSGDPDADALDNVTRVSIAVAVIMCGNFLLNKLIEVASLISKDLTSTLTIDKRSFSEMFLDIIKNSLTSTTIEMFIIIIFLVVILVSFIIFILKAGKRGAEIILFGIMMPIMACDLLTTNRERWNAFFTELMICVFGYILQLFSFNVFMMLFAEVMRDVMDIKYMIAALAWLMVVLSAPKWLQKFTYSSGIGNAAKGGVRTAGYMLPTMLRR